jgi:hypothetical protein
VLRRPGRPHEYVPRRPNTSDTDKFCPVKRPHLLDFVGAAELGSALDEEWKGAAALVAGMRDANKHTALHFAAREGLTKVCHFLV